MTLIATYITREGMVHAADSNITTEHEDRDPEVTTGPKVFRAQHVNAGCCVTGSYRVGGERFDRWITHVIDQSAHEGDVTIAAFAERLRQRLQNEMTREQKYDGGTLVYVGGFVETDAGAHPEVYAVRNMSLDTTTGAYVNAGYTFDCDEQFWTRDYSLHKLATGLAAGDHVLYANGFPPGRSVYLTLDTWLSRFFEQVWHAPNWQFRAPRTLAEHESLIKQQMNVITALMRMSNYDAPYIGGTIHTVTIEPLDGKPWI